MTTSESGLAAEHLLFNALEGLRAGDVRPWVEMFHDDGVMEFPFAPPPLPSRVESKAAIGEHLRHYPDTFAVERFTRDAVYHSDNVMVVEFTGEGKVIANGNRYVMPYIAVITVVDGKFKHYRDYWNPLVAIKAMGTPDLAFNISNQEQNT